MLIQIRVKLYRVWSWPHSEDMKAPEFPERDYEVVRHVFMKVHAHAVSIHLMLWF